MSEQVLKLIGGAVAWEGAVSLEISEAGIKPWRIPWEERELFHPHLLGRAGQPSGVRMTFRSDTGSLRIAVEPTQSEAEWVWDLLVDGEMKGRVAQSSNQSEIRFEWETGVPQGGGSTMRLIELYLPSQYLEVTVKGAWIDGGARAEAWIETRPRFVVYGSSITQAKEAAGPSETWVSIVTRKHGMHQTNMGFGGQEHLEPSMARVIAERPADMITLCVSGNVWGCASLSERTYRAAVIGMVEIIRARKPVTPVALLSSIHLPEDEGKPNVLGLNVEDYRQMTREAAESMIRRGDRNLHFMHGPELYGPQYIQYCDDGVHPNAQGQRVLAARFSQMVMPVLWR